LNGSRDFESLILLLVKTPYSISQLFCSLLFVELPIGVGDAAALGFSDTVRKEAKGWGKLTILIISVCDMTASSLVVHRVLL
jgi:hypothetical protein